jgi:hypothetical protein
MTIKGGGSIELLGTRVRFYSQLDETAFFEWLKNIRCTKGVRGSGEHICIDINIEELTAEDLRDLLAIFYRYKINMKQLLALNKPEFHAWFHNKNAYWYKDVFEAVVE